MATRIATLGLPGPRTGIGAAILALPRWLVLLAAATAVRAVTFGDPAVHIDEQFYFVTAQRMLHGAIPFVDIWDRKPVGLFLLYTPAAALGTSWGILGYQLMALASVTLTALLIARIADRVGWRRGAMPAALLYLLMLNMADGQGGQAPVFYNLLTAAAVALILPQADDRGEDRRRIGRGLLAMLLIGLGLQIKYSVLFEGLFLGLWLLHREWRLGATPLHILRRGLAYAGMAGLPTLVAGATYAQIGHFDAWFYANFASILNRKSDPAIELLSSFVEVTGALSPLLIVSGMSWRRLSHSGRVTADTAFLFGWLVSAIVGLILFGSYFNHYALPVMLPGCICTAGYLGSDRLARRIVTPLLLGLTLAIGGLAMTSSLSHRGNEAQMRALADLAGRGPGCMFVYSGDPILYSYTGRCTVSRWVFPSHLARKRENGAIGVDQIAEIDRIFTARPAIVVMRARFNGERPDTRARMRFHLDHEGYQLRGTTLMGDVPIAVYALPRDKAPDPRFVVTKRA